MDRKPSEYVYDAQAPSVVNPRRPVTWLVKFAFSIGYIPLYLSTLLISIYFNNYLTDVIKMSVAKAGDIILIGQIFDIFIDPIVGGLVDNTTTTFGRRRPWLLIAAVPFGYFYFLLWLDFTKMTTTDQLLYYVFVYLFFKIATSSITIPHASLLPDLTSDYNERTQMTSLKLFTSLAISILLCYFQTLMINDYTPANIAATKHVASKGYVVAGAIYGAVMGLCPIITFLFVRENFDPHSIPPLEFIPLFRRIIVNITTFDRKNPFFLGAHNLFDCLRNGPFMLVCFISLVSWTMLQINSSNLIYYLSYVLQVKTPLKKFTYVLAISQGSLCISMVVWMFVAKRLGKKKTFYLGRVFSLAASIIIYTLGSDSARHVVGKVVTIDYTSYYWFLSGLVLGGIGNSVILLIPWAMLPDTLDYHELKFGKRQESFMYGIFVMLQKASLAIAIFGTSRYLSHEGFVSGAVVQPPDVQKALKITFCLVPIGCTVLSVFLVWLYPITRQRLSEIQDDLRSARLEKQRLFE